MKVTNAMRIQGIGLRSCGKTMARDGNFTGKPETRRVWGMGEDFDPRVRPTPDPKFYGCGCGFLFQPAGDPHPTRNPVHSLFCAKMIKIQ